MRQPVLPDDEEGPRHMRAFEYVEDARRPLGIGSVVERQRDRLARGARPLDDVGRRQRDRGHRHGPNVRRAREGSSRAGHDLDRMSR